MAVVLHVVVGLIWGLAAGLFVPAPDIYALWAIWFVLLGAVMALRSRPWLCLAIPFVATAGFIVATILLGADGTGRWEG